MNSYPHDKDDYYRRVFSYELSDESIEKILWAAHSAPSKIGPAPKALWRRNNSNLKQTILAMNELSGLSIELCHIFLTVWHRVPFGMFGAV